MKKDAEVMKPAEPAQEGRRLITGINVGGTGDMATVTVSGNGPLSCTAWKNLSYDGVVLYFLGTGLGGVPKEITPAGGLVEKVTSAESEGEVSTRVEIMLKKDAPFEVSQEGSQVVVSLNASGAAPAGEAMSSAAPVDVGAALLEAEPMGETEIAEVEISEEAPVPLEAYVADKQREAAAKIPKKARLRQIDFIQEADGRSVVRVVANRPVDYMVRRVGERQLVMDLTDVTIPEEQQRPLITTRFDSAADRIIPLMKKDGTASISIELRQFVPYRVVTDNNEILLSLDASDIPARPLVEAGLPPWEQVMSMTALGKEPESADETFLDASSESNLGITEPKKFTGEKIALDFYRTDIKNVFRILKEVSGLNFAIDPGVEGEVTLTIDKPVPWDQILYLVLKMNQLGSVRTGDIIRIAPLSTLDEEANAARERIEAENQKKAAQRASEIIEEMNAKSQQPRRLEYIPINYAKCKEISDHLTSIMEDAPALSADGTGTTTTEVKKFPNIRCDERTNTILIIDTDSDIEDARAMIEQLDHPTPQVMIEARIVEANSTFTRDIGVDWSGSAGIQPGDARQGIGPQRGYDTLGGTYGYNWAINYPIQDTYNTFGFNFTRIMGLTPLEIDATLGALENRGTLKIVSAPKVLTLDNKKAMIKQGVEFPIKKLDDAGNTTVEYHDVDLLLEVTPHVTADRRVSMAIRTTKNDLGEVIEGEQSFNTKVAETELLLNDGDTIVIGGIIKTTKQSDIQGVPWLSQVPILGWLFKSEAMKDNREELLVFITPRIVDLEQ